MDPGLALVLAAIIAALPGIGTFALLVVATLRLGKVEKQTNHLQDILQAQSTAAGIRIGQEEERRNPTALGTPSPKLP